MECKPDIKVKPDQLESVLFDLSAQEEVGAMRYMEILVPSIYCTY